MTGFLPPEPNEVTKPEAAPSKRADPWAIGLGIVGGVLLGTGLTFAILGMVGVFEEPVPPTLPPPPTLTIPEASAPTPTFGEPTSAAEVAERVVPSIVAVEVSSFLAEGSGSGVVLGTDGYIITNHHVVDGSAAVAVVFSDGARFPAEVVGSDEVTDIAVLLVDRTDLYPIELGLSEDLVIGQPALAIGNPLGLEGGPTVTSGIVSALDRSLTIGSDESLFGLVQTDAPIAPGSSGGALVDAAGKLIGITTAIAVSDVGPEGLGFAVPIDLAIGVVNDLITTGEVRHALLGINGVTAWASSEGADYPVGVSVESVATGSAYDTATGQVNDVIVALDGVEINTIDSLLARLRRFREGDTVPIRILRANEETVLDVTMDLLTP